MTPEPLVLDPAAGITVQMGESRLTIKLDADATGGRIALCSTMSPRTSSRRELRIGIRESLTPSWSWKGGSGSSLALASLKEHRVP